MRWVTAGSPSAVSLSPTSAVPTAFSQEHLLLACLSSLTSVTISDVLCGTWEVLSRAECFLCGWTSRRLYHSQGPWPGSPVLTLQALPHSCWLSSDVLAGPSCGPSRMWVWLEPQAEYPSVQKF